MSTVETAEPIEMQLGMLSWMGPGNMYYTGDVNAPIGVGTFWGVWPIDRILWLGKRVTCAKNGWTNPNDLDII